MRYRIKYNKNIDAYFIERKILFWFKITEMAYIDSVDVLYFCTLTGAEKYIMDKFNDKKNKRYNNILIKEMDYNMFNNQTISRRN